MVVPDGSVTVTAGKVVTEEGRVIVVVMEGDDTVIVVVLVVAQPAPTRAIIDRPATITDRDRLFIYVSSFSGTIDFLIILILTS